jgi:hypothetical protein
MPNAAQSTPTSALNTATVDLEDLSSAFLDLEEPLREARYMASVMNLLVHEHGTNLPPSRTFELSENEMSRLFFVAGKVEEMVVKLDQAFRAAFDAKGRAVQ